VFYLINDPSPQIRKVVCESFVQMVHMKVDFLIPKFDQVVDFMLRFTKDEDELVALEACEFWLAVCDARLKDNVRPHLPR
jgi:transportin-1